MKCALKMAVRHKRIFLFLWIELWEERGGNRNENMQTLLFCVLCAVTYIFGIQYIEDLACCTT